LLDACSFAVILVLGRHLDGCAELAPPHPATACPRQSCSQRLAVSRPRRFLRVDPGRRRRSGSRTPRTWARPWRNSTTCCTTATATAGWRPGTRPAPAAIPGRRRRASGDPHAPRGRVL